MISLPCQHERRRKHGKTKAGTPRYRCSDCGKCLTESTEKLDGMRIGMDKAVQIITCLVRGSSIEATADISETDPQTVTNLMVQIGEKCKRYMERELQDICVDDVQVDEIWQYVYAKSKTVKRKNLSGDVGDSYCYTGIERSTKLLVAWHLGRRTQEDTDTFCEKLRNATAGRYQLTTDGYACYRSAVDIQLRNRVDYGMLIKNYATGSTDDVRKYSPPSIISAKKEKISGNPNDSLICTSHAERMNGSIRCYTKRMGRLTYCFSKRWDYHECALALGFAWYNWCHKHRSLKGQSPAMASGLTDHVLTVRELIETVCVC